MPVIKRTHSTKRHPCVHKALVISLQMFVVVAANQLFFLCTLQWHTVSPPLFPLWCLIICNIFSSENNF